MRWMSSTLLFQSENGSTLRSGSERSRKLAPSPDKDPAVAARRMLLGGDAGFEGDDVGPRLVSIGDGDRDVWRLATVDVDAIILEPPCMVEPARAGLCMKEWTRTSPRGAVGWPAEVRSVGTASPVDVHDRPVEANEMLCQLLPLSPKSPKPVHAVVAVDGCDGRSPRKPSFSGGRYSLCL
mmetsp:Transcript_4299/g.14555  ORF Transcript_4299/g.14555 Transcript_4299/m.14555 type:complete len:181 (-) Transcript_4299:976-1518(-)